MIGTILYLMTKIPTGSSYRGYHQVREWNVEPYHEWELDGNPRRWREVIYRLPFISGDKMVVKVSGEGYVLIRYPVVDKERRFRETRGFSSFVVLKVEEDVRRLLKESPERWQEFVDPELLSLCPPKKPTEIRIL